eukprot:TRINITY_DN7592_c0_g1_i1.p1 TRINITY_DN7592_c0_g1~~TRINITY_DN7592_c0_g1_i1.p1  ORF type:complete len:715 (-),score=219.41 TRINITY_DN7592_c0_g1_i1:61-2205(-)
MSEDLSEKFSYPIPFCASLLQLSSHQMTRFHAWRRPHEISKGPPKIISMISPFSIQQTLISDCSFVAAISVSAAYERRHKRQLLTSKIFPQDSQGNPVYNPSGKYMIQLILNGIPRKVIIDDRLPVDSRGNLLCSFSNNSEFWVSLIEKAYMQVHGGYNFPGSTGEIDLHCLTGWIPETIDLEAEDFSSKSEKEWLRMYNGNSYGDCLMTISTGDLDANSAEILGLVPCHAYAVLDIREVNGIKLMQVKNPWSLKRWKGPYSQNDTKRWTPELQKALNFDVMTALLYDNGVFWIDFDSVKKFFGKVHLNWNPQLFAHRYSIHSHWALQQSAKDFGGKSLSDSFYIGDNPQYSLQVENSGNQSASIWILLQKHVTKRTEFVEEFITMNVIESSPGRFYYPQPKLLTGVYINSPMILSRFDAPTGKHHYTLLISQLEKKHDIYYTLQIFSTAAFTVSEIPMKNQFEKRHVGDWDSDSGSHSDILQNPQFILTCQKKTFFNLKLMTYRDYSVNLQVLSVKERNLIDFSAKSNTIANSGDYRRQFCVCQFWLEAGAMAVVIPTTFERGQSGKFVLLAEGNSEFNLSRLPPEGEGMHKKVISGQWDESSAGGNPSLNYLINPRYRIRCMEPTSLQLRLKSDELPTPPLNITIFKASDFKAILGTSGPYINKRSGVSTGVKSLEKGDYVAIASTHAPIFATFSITCYSSHLVEITQDDRR